jgi:hypothetical protein
MLTYQDVLEISSDQAGLQNPNHKNQISGKRTIFHKGEGHYFCKAFDNSWDTRGNICEREEEIVT